MSPATSDGANSLLTEGVSSKFGRLQITTPCPFAALVEEKKREPVIDTAAPGAHTHKWSHWLSANVRPSGVAMETEALNDPQRRASRLRAGAVFVFAAVLLDLSAAAADAARRPHAEQPVHKDSRTMCRARVEQYRSILDLYRRQANTDGRLQILTRFLSEGPRWMDMLITSKGLDAEETRVAERTKQAMSRYAQNAPRSISAAPGTESLVQAVVSHLDELGNSLRRRP